MRLIKKLIHNNVKKLDGKVFERRAARGIILKGSKILLLYTKRYNDYSFPGGGVDSNEDLITGLKRELAEETGAKNVEVISEFGYIDEYRPHYKPEYDLIHMLSYFYICKIDDDFEDVNLEDYEIANGMSSIWIDIYEAIRHNKDVIANQEKSMGFSIERETLALELIVEELLTNHT
ncbi:NUDIX hydrolase [Clostridium sp.]|uniref:NUDIX hydrolase n=1 Tax=Clostridium sp. TaxID=1506 RepID=UPI003EEFFEB4